MAQAGSGDENGALITVNTSLRGASFHGSHPGAAAPAAAAKSQIPEGQTWFVNDAYFIARAKEQDAQGNPVEEPLCVVCGAAWGAVCGARSSSGGHGAWATR